VEVGTPYDLASLTKPLVATTALRMIAAGVLEPGLKAEAVLGDVRGTPGGAATLEQLLTHTSGLAPWGGLYLDVPHEPGSSAARRWIVSEAARRPKDPGTPAQVYSDLGYIIAGEVMARSAGVSLDRLVQTHTTGVIGISDRLFYAGAVPAEQAAQLARRAAPTERCDWRGRIVHGEVHDENCAALGGVSGHAGMFGTSKAVAMFGRVIVDSLAGRSDFLSAEVMTNALAARDGGTYRFGWDTKSGADSAAGRRMGPRAFGHLGFTGTSLWNDPDRDIVVVLLSNRVHPSRANEKIKGFRPAFHDGVVAAFDA
jgi:CubicO group peptidase (beta-lactamase class C family)